MSKLTNIEQLYRERAKQRLIRRMVTFTILALIVIGGFYIFRMTEDFDIKQGLEQLADSFTKGPGYPVSIPQGKVYALGQMGSSVTLLDDTNFYRYSGSGKEQMNVQHGYYRPMAVQSSDRVVIFDQGATSLRVDSRSKNLFNKVYPYDIITADINSSNQVAVATGASRYAASVTVYNKNFEEIYIWQSENLITDLTLAEKDNMMAVSTVETVDGTLRTTIRFLKFSSEEEYAQLVLDDQMVYSIDFKGKDNTLYVITDQNVYGVSTQGVVLTRYSFDNQPLWAYDNTDETAIGLAVGDYDQQRKLNLYQLDLNLNSTGPVAISDHILSMECAQGNLYVLAENMLYSYNNKLELVQSLVLPDAKAMTVIGDHLYYVTSGEIQKLSLSS